MSVDAQIGARIGVFGGAFDPPHRAHLALAQAAIAQFSLSQLIVLPTGQAWHKVRGLSAAQHRLAMAKSIFEPLPQVQVDDRELRRAGPTYTIDSMTELQAEHPGIQLRLLLGQDQACALERWHRWQDLLKIAIICVATRVDSNCLNANLSLQNDANEGHPAPAQLEATGLPEFPELSKLPAAVRAAGRFEALRMPPMMVSATDIRQRVASGLGIANLVTEPVARYIADHHLYLSN